MADVFVSYSQKADGTAEAVVKGLQSRGYSVWWDKGLTAGKNFNESILDQLREASAVVVIWSTHSVVSQYVQMEAGIAFAWNKLITVCEPGLSSNLFPEPFRTLHAWDSTNFDQIVNALDAKGVARSALAVNGAALTIDQFCAAIAKHDASLPDKLMAWLQKCQAIGLSVELKKNLLIKSQLWKTRSINFATLTPDNRVWMDYVVWQCEQLGVREVGIAYLNKMAALVPNAVAVPNRGILIFGHFVSLSTLLTHGDAWISAIQDTRHDIQSYIEEKN